MAAITMSSSLAASAGLGVRVGVSALICTSHLLFGVAQLSGTESDCPGVGSAAGPGGGRIAAVVVVVIK